MSEPQTTQPGNGDPASAEDKTLDKLLSEAQARIDEQRDAWMRALAETENVRKRALADVAAAHKYAVERFAESLLPVMDSLESALSATEGAPQAMRDGVELTLRQLNSAFQKASAAAVGSLMMRFTSSPAMRPASLVAWRCESLKYAGTVITASVTSSPR